LPGYARRETEQQDTAPLDPSAGRSPLSLFLSVSEKGGGWGLSRLWVFYWVQAVLGYAISAVIGLGLVGYLERRPPA
jgi:hypothetical protein